MYICFGIGINYVDILVLVSTMFFNAVSEHRRRTLVTWKVKLLNCKTFSTMESANTQTQAFPILKHSLLFFYNARLSILIILQIGSDSMREER